MRVEPVLLCGSWERLFMQTGTHPTRAGTAQAGFSPPELFYNRRAKWPLLGYVVNATLVWGVFRATSVSLSVPGNKKMHQGLSGPLHTHI